jgi:hypothetical protein
LADSPGEACWIKPHVPHSEDKMMDRRRALAAIGGFAGGVSSCAVGQANESVKSSLPGAVPIPLDERVRVDVQSAPVKVGERDFHIISIGTGLFHLDKDDRLTAILNAGVSQYAEMEYRIVVAVFDTAGRLLGVAQHDEPVAYVRLGATPRIFREIEFDFGVSKAFRRAAFAITAISERDVPVAK